MGRGNVTDLIGGLLLVAIGVFMGGYSALSYDMGSFQQMGPGMFPVGVGISLVLFGLGIFLPALWARREVPKIYWRASIAVVTGLAAFALILPFFGVVPAIAGLTLIASFAEERPSPLFWVLLTAGLSVVILLLFSFGLGVPLRPFQWP